MKVSTQDSIKLSPKFGVNENSSSGFKQRLPKWDLGESFSSKLNQTPPKLRFSSSSNPGLKKRLPKWNFIESSSLRFDFFSSHARFCLQFQLGTRTKTSKVKPYWKFSLELDHFQCKTLLKVGLDLFSLGINSNNSQVRFGCNSNSGPYNEFPSKALVKFPGRGSIKNISQITY